MDTESILYHDSTCSGSVQSYVRPPRVLSVVDSTWALVICFPVLCSYWRGSWSLLSYYVLPGLEPVRFWVMYAVGASYVVTFWFLEPLEKALEGASSVKYFVVTRMLLVYQGALYMFLWRGIWGLNDHYIGHGFLDNCIWMGATLMALILLGCLRSTLWPPYFIVLDTRKDLLKPVTRFGVQQSEDGQKFLADSVLTALIITPLAIVAWTCAFDVLDSVIYPDDPLLSAYVCLGFGVGGTVLLFILQKPIGEVSARLELRGRHNLKLLWEDLMYLVVFLFMAPSWRGLWNLNTTFLITDDKLGGWVHLGIGMVGLMATQTYSYVAVWGCIMDGEDAGGKAFFPHQYFQQLYIYKKMGMQAKNVRRMDVASKFKLEDSSDYESNGVPSSEVLGDTVYQPSSISSTNTVSSIANDPDITIGSLSNRGSPIVSNIFACANADTCHIHECIWKNFISSNLSEYPIRNNFWRSLANMMVYWKVA